MAMKVSAQATPRPETMPERRFLLSVRWMQSTATGPTVIEAATPTPMPRRRIAKISKPISSLFRIQIAKIGKQSQFRSGDTEKRRTGGHKVSGSAGAPPGGRVPTRSPEYRLLLSVTATTVAVSRCASYCTPSCCRILLPLQPLPSCLSLCPPPVFFPPVAASCRRAGGVLDTRRTGRS